MKTKDPASYGAKQIMKFTVPFPVRLSAANDRTLTEIQRKTGLNRAAILRIGLDWFLPRMLAGEINPFALMAADGVEK